MFRQALNPSEFVIELGAGRRIAVGKIEAADEDAVDLGLEVAALYVVRVAGQASTSLQRILTARENGDAVPALLAVPDHAVAGLADSGFRKLLLRRLQFLETRDIGPGFGEPAQKHRQPAIDAIDVEGCDLHGRGSVAEAFASAVLIAASSFSATT